MEEREPIEFDWDPVPGDWGDALRATVRAYRWAPWYAGALAVMGIVLLFIGSPLAGGFGLIAAVVIAAMPVVQIHLAFKRNPVADRKVTGVADATALRMTTIDGTAHSDVEWTTVPGWLETSRTFVLRSQAGGLYPVPHRAFAGDKEREAFRELLRTAVGEPSSRGGGAAASPETPPEPA
ncbi:YcxB-like protein [Herbihabitans rhizosphaerae]|uniref:YcxB-like protein n=1 Tax=Herbihabitans rhizosphaerae TaxID=1872711 RepID=A0A4Q7L199_9PSEU|nr:YcxB family protein [Herbihabitans rhizosphaerae]RZS43279.1 YcxB-like protein [Herbihabitans rhizosphaerae]